jgi:hypothetical protein
MTAGMPAADELSAVGAFSSEVDTGSREENASKLKSWSLFGSDFIRTEKALITRISPAIGQ